MKRGYWALLPLLPWILWGCDKGMAYGDPNVVIVAAPPEWWPELKDSVFAALAPDVYTLRAERMFRLNYDDPTHPDWGLKRRFREEVLIGGAGHLWIQEALAARKEPATEPLPALYEVKDVWARNQVVTLIVVDTLRPVAPQVFGLIGEVQRRLEARYREGVRTRMFASGKNEELADSLWRVAGFSLLVPKVYRWGVTLDSLYWFRNDNPTPAELIRQFAVTWRTPIPSDLGVDSLLAWKEHLSQVAYTYPQVVERETVRTRSLRLGDWPVFEVRGTWTNPPDSQWPAAGPFFLWTVTCPAQDRLYLIDAWLYAPGKDKWEYVLQIETILESFRCGG